MVKRTPAIRLKQPMNGLIEFDHFVGLVFKVLIGGIKPCNSKYFVVISVIKFKILTSKVYNKLLT